MIPQLVSFIGAFYLRLVGNTSFIQNVDDPAFKAFRRDRKPVIYALWHNNQVALACAHRGEKVHVIVSKSKDGEYIARVMERLGLIPVRGSSSRGGEQALREIMGVLEKGGQAGFTPDGPKGPVQSIQQGVIWAAQNTGVPVVAVGAASRRQMVFNSWDKFKVPLPFSHLVISHEKPFFISPDEKPDKAEEKVRSALNRAQITADEEIKKSKGWRFIMTGRIILWIYKGLSGILSPLILLYCFLKFGFRRSLRDMSERWGRGNFFPPANFPRVWFHAASVGEWRALHPILKEFMAQKGLEMVVTVTTATAKKLVLAEAPGVFVKLLPLDFGWLLNRWIRQLNPHSFCVIESELWPNLIDTVSRLHIPGFILNGRLSQKSFMKWRKFSPLVSQELRYFSHLYVRTERDRIYFSGLGARENDVEVLGNSKADNLIILSPEQKTEKRKSFLGDWSGVCVIGVSTWPGEEELILKLLDNPAHQNVRIILVPRKMARINEILNRLNSKNLTSQLFSDVKKGRKWESQILLVDTFGDMRELCAVADMAFVGGSIYPKGGQNPLEPAAARLALVFGPSMENFEDESRGLLQSAGALQGDGAESVAVFLNQLISDRSLREKMGASAAEELGRRQGVAKKIVEKLRIQLDV